MGIQSLESLGLGVSGESLEDVQLGSALAVGGQNATERLGKACQAQQMVFAQHRAGHASGQRPVSLGGELQAPSLTHLCSALCTE